MNPLELVIVGLGLSFILGVACLALAVYWFARGSVWDKWKKTKAFRNARVDLLLALPFLGIPYSVAYGNSLYCWQDGAVELPFLSYRCVDGVRKPHWSAYDFDKM